MCVSYMLGVKCYMYVSYVCLQSGYSMCYLCCYVMSLYARCYVLCMFTLYVHVYSYVTLYVSRAYVCIQASYYYRKIYGSYTWNALYVQVLYNVIHGALLVPFTVYSRCYYMLYDWMKVSRSMYTLYIVLLLLTVCMSSMLGVMWYVCAITGWLLYVPIYCWHACSDIWILHTKCTCTFCCRISLHLKVDTESHSTAG